MDDAININANLIYVVAGAFVALATGTFVRVRSLKKAAKGEVQKRLDSLRSWWIISAAVAAAVLMGSYGVVALVAIVSWLSMREFLQLAELRKTDRSAQCIAIVLISVHFTLIALRLNTWAIAFFPGPAFLIVGIVWTLNCAPHGFLSSAARYYWGIILTIYALSHAAMLATEPQTSTPSIGILGPFLFVVVLTELNDIAQALVGRRFGRRKITPIVSPNKTWEGLAGGIAVTGITAMLLGNWLLPPEVSHFTSVALGMGLSVVGFFGDIHMSAFKRDVGVKDSGDLLPGQGGILDRIDSLTFTAPAFYYLTMWLNS